MRLVSAIIVSLLAGTAIFGIYHIIVLFSKMNDFPTATDSPSAIVECNGNVNSDEPCFGLAMTTRDEWLAQPPNFHVDKLVLPVARMGLTHTETAECTEKAKCKYIIRNIQGSDVIANGDIKYNFLLSTTGDVYEGRGWNRQSAETGIQKLNTYLIGFIGNFTENPVWHQQLQALNTFAKVAISAGKLSEAFDCFCSSNILFSLNDTRSGMNGDYVKCQIF